MGKILIIDDEQSMREFLTICLRRAGHVPTVAKNANEAFEKLRDHPFDIVLTDLRLPGELDGIGILRAIKSGTVQRAPAKGEAPAAINPEVILMTAYASANTAIEAETHLAAAPDGALCSAWISRHNTLPVLDLGSALRNSTQRGVL